MTMPKHTDKERAKRAAEAKLILDVANKQTDPIIANRLRLHAQLINKGDI